MPPNASPPEAPRVNHRASQGWKRPLTSERLVRLTNAGREWATEQLDALLGHTEFYRRPDPPDVVNFTSQLSTRGAQHDIVASAQVVEQIVMAGRQVESAAKFGSTALQGRDMKPDAKIKTTDLEQALDYLEGLSFIMRSFDESSRGREGRDILLEGLQAMDGGAMSWKPLRHQAAAGQGWADIADHVDELRRRLLEGFAGAAL